MSHNSRKKTKKDSKTGQKKPSTKIVLMILTPIIFIGQIVNFLITFPYKTYTKIKNHNFNKYIKVLNVKKFRLYFSRLLNSKSKQLKKNKAKLKKLYKRHSVIVIKKLKSINFNKLNFHFKELRKLLSKDITATYTNRFPKVLLTPISLEPIRNYIIPHANKLWVELNKPIEIDSNLIFSAKKNKKNHSSKSQEAKKAVKKKTAKEKKQKKLSVDGSSLLVRVKRLVTLTGIFVAGVVFAVLFILIPVLVSGWFRQLPQPDLLAQAPTKSTKILDRNGRLLYEIYTDRKYAYVDLEKIPSDLINATLSVEDETFYRHMGVRPLSMLRAAKATVVDDELQGASTITQQLIKNVLLSPERTYSRKVKEVVLALMVEQKYSKDEILELYLNNVAYGGTAWGVESASQKYFGKDVWELDLAESSMLAGLPLSPTTYSPVNNFEKAKARQRFVLSKMVEQGFITAHDANTAYAKELEFAPQVDYIRAPHFVNYVRDELIKTYGQRMVEFGGLTVTTTLDLDVQDKVQDIVREEVKNHEEYNITNGASVVLDSQTGEVLAYVGSKDYFAKDYDGAFDVARAFRQPGSSIKILTYALAIENGLTPVTSIADTPFSVTSYGTTYSPKNYDGKYHGTVSLRSALANSYNIPAVKLAQRLGPDNIVSLGKDLGLTGWEVDNTYGLAITLGGKEVRLLDLANVYASFARQGSYVETTPFISVKDSNGFELYRDEREPKQVLSEGTAYLISHILSDNSARTPAFGPSSALVVSGHPNVAVKTGTTDLNRDNLTVGFTPTYTVGVWVGNNNNDPMNSRLVSGLSGAAPIWNRIMSTLLENVEDEPFSKPGSVIVKYDKRCNRSEVFVEGSEVSNLCPEKKTTKPKKD